MKVLILEPDKLLAKTYRKSFELENLDVIYVSCAQDAVDVCDQETPDVIVMELQLAGNNGVEFIQELRSYPEWFNIPIIINTNVTPKEAGLNTDNLAVLGVVDYLHKPDTTLEKLVQKIRAVKQ